MQPRPGTRQRRRGALDDTKIDSDPPAFAPSTPKSSRLADIVKTPAAGSAFLDAPRAPRDNARPDFERPLEETSSLAESFVPARRVTVDENAEPANYAGMTNAFQNSSSSDDSLAATQGGRRQRATEEREKGATSKGRRRPGEGRKPRPRILCTNNANHQDLIENGGTRELGTNQQCFRRGVGAGLHAQPEDMEQFLRSFSYPYKKLVEQPLYYGDGQVPSGKFLATRPQCMQRGFGVGQMLLAKRILAERSQPPAREDAKW